MTDIVVHQPATVPSIAEQAEFARMVTSGQGQSLLPDIYRGSPANVLIAVGLGASMGLSPAESLYRISVIKGKPSAGAELIAANVRRAGHKLRVRGDETTCTATIIRADDPDFPFEVTRDLAWAKQMGLASNDNYKRQPGTMLQWRAITAVARLACPEALYGVSYTPDELSESTSPSAPVASAPKDALRAKLRQPAPDPAPDAPDGITEAQSKKLHALLREAGIPDREMGLRYCSDVTGREIATTKDLTREEASRVIDALERDLAPAEQTLDVP